MAVNCNDMQSLALCLNTTPAQEYPRPLREAADQTHGQRCDAHSGSRTEQTFEFPLVRHRSTTKGKEVEMRFLFSLQCFSFLLAG